MSYFENVDIKLADSATADAFGRLRVSDPIALFENDFRYDLNPLDFSNSLVGSGSITHLPNESAAELSTGGTASGDAAILQTKRYMRYQPGKSHVIEMTGTLGAQKANVRQRIGYFDDQNGLFFEQTETDVAVVLRSFTTGSVVDTRTTQPDWNLDVMDGTGPSGITLDLTKSHIFHIDFQYLGTGRVRFGFVIAGLLCYVHEINNANNLATVYMTTPDLPCRASIENTDVAASATTMKQFCMAVVSEGGVSEEIAKGFAIGRGTTALAVTTRRPVLSIRPRTTFNSITNRGHVTFREVDILASTNNVLWELVLNGTLTGASWSNVDTTYSITEYDTAATAISGGVVVGRGWGISGIGAAVGRSQGGTITELFNDFAGTNPDRLSLVCTAFTGTSNINAQMQWTEQR